MRLWSKTTGPSAYGGLDYAMIRRLSRRDGHPPRAPLSPHAVLLRERLRPCDTSASIAETEEETW
jgi:hypothetical protein